MSGYGLEGDLIIRTKPKINEGFNPLMSGYGLEGMNTSYETLIKSDVSILLCLDTGWKPGRRRWKRLRPLFQSSYVWIRAGRRLDTSLYVFAQRFNPLMSGYGPEDL